MYVRDGGIKQKDKKLLLVRLGRNKMVRNSPPRGYNHRSEERSHILGHSAHPSHGVASRTSIEGLKVDAFLKCAPCSREMRVVQRKLVLYRTSVIPGKS